MFPHSQQQHSSVRLAARAIGANNSNCDSQMRRFFPIEGRVRHVAHALRLVDGATLAGEQHPLAEVSPTNGLTRQAMSWEGAGAELIEWPAESNITFRFRAPVHLLVAYEQAERIGGETAVQGLPASTLRKLSQRMTFVPAGHDYQDHYAPGTAGRVMLFYFKPSHTDAAADQSAAASLSTPRLLFEDAALWHSASRLSARLKSATMSDQPYLKALGTVLMYDLLCGVAESTATPAMARGGLAGWQQRIVANHIQKHFAEQIRLATLARLAHLSPHHFCRAFKQSFGKPPHRYQNDYRIEQAKLLLTQPDRSVTDIAMQIGFGSSSSFATAFRKVTGQTPTGYARSRHA